MLRQDALTDIETWLARHAKSRMIAKGTRVFASGEKPASLFWVTAGELQLVRHTPRGERVILQRCWRGALAEASLFSDRYHCDGEAAADSLAWVLPLADFHAALSEADLSRAYTRWLSHTIRDLRGQCERLSLPQGSRAALPVRAWPLCTARLLAQDLGRRARHDARAFVSHPVDAA